MFHFFVEENNLIILGNNNPIIINLNEAAEHIHKLSLLPCTLEIFTISLIEGSCKEINEQESDYFVELHPCIPRFFNMWVIPHPDVSET